MRCPGITLVQLHQSLLNTCSRKMRENKPKGHVHSYRNKLIPWKVRSTIVCVLGNEVFSWWQGACGGSQGVFGGLQGACDGLQGACGGLQGACGGLQGACGGFQVETVCDMCFS